MNKAGFPYPEHLEALAPEIALALLAMGLLLIDLFVPKQKKVITGWLALGSLFVTAAALLFVLQAEPVLSFYGLFVLDPLAGWTKLMVLLGAGLTILASVGAMRGVAHEGEYYVLLLFSVLGIMLMASSNNFFVFFLGLELSSLAIYVLVGYLRGVLRSAEAAVKYFVLGALSSGMLLYGMSFLYGVSGSFEFAAIGKALAAASESARLAVALGLVFLVAGVAFKISLAPFHMWTPDAYEGAPTPITGFLSTAAKFGVFVVFVRILHEALAPLAQQAQAILAFLAVASILIGNLAAIVQRNIKRMLAYSTIGHAGFVVLGLIAGGLEGYASVIGYLTIYLVMAIAAFAVVQLLAGEGFAGEAIEEYAGLARVRPGYALAMGLLLFSLAGIPFLAGFWAKYYVFLAAVQAGWVKLVIFAVVFSVIGAYYYIRVVKFMFFDAPRPGAFEKLPRSASLDAAVFFGALFVVALGLYPDPVFEICRRAIAAFL